MPLNYPYRMTGLNNSLSPQGLPVNLTMGTVAVPSCLLATYSVTALPYLQFVQTGIL